MLAPAMEQGSGRGTTLGRARREVGFVRSWPAVPDTVAQVRRTVVERIRVLGATPAALAAVELAVSEAVTNVVQHAYADVAQPGEVTARVEVEDAYVLVAVSDDGSGMRPRPDSPGLGLGLPLISTVARTAKISAGPGGLGTRVRMTFGLDCAGALS